MYKKVVLITGASRGIGRETARLFAKSGYNIVINYNNSFSDAMSLKQELEKKCDVLMVKADVSNEDEVKMMVDKIVDKFGFVDVLVNNAGISIDEELDDKSKESFLKVLSVNLIGPFLVTKYVSKHMKDTSSIINVSSNNALDQGYIESIDYDASKNGLISLGSDFAKELAPIRVNTILPGWVITDMNKNLSEEQVSSEKRKILLNRFADAVEVGEVILFLASEKASYINNAIIRVDGGMR